MSINTDLGHPDQPPLATPLSFSKTVLPVLIVTLLSLTATMIAGKITSAAVNTRLTEYFNHQADQVSNTFYSNLDSHITALEGLRGLWNAQGFYNHDTFHAYINSLSLEDTYGSGVSSFFFITPVSKNQKIPLPKNNVVKPVSQPLMPHLLSTPTLPQTRFIPSLTLSQSKVGRARLDSILVLSLTVSQPLSMPAIIMT